ncbi:RICIN domain-containing protein [Pseudosporangium ferrugineum]|uniref:Ricin-type beta-trefoil lectin protein n=1 Tax=Pseudosporangium ferrugineum TaxID=439699 RepID=A0A2T0S845_9ACTN|nr:ricin-type beta-trefoil lectin domain protein [Pseudosporangium ferrugineum]PRY29565.1 ricin-type beta-trefoil lectin protein [Pseudosporangium ferrugineum]
MSPPMWTVLALALATLAAGLIGALRAIRRGRAPQWWPAPARPVPSLAHQWASQTVETRPGRHVRAGRTARLIAVAGCGTALVALGSVVTLAVTGDDRPRERFVVAVSGESVDDVAYGPRIVSEDSALCLAARSLADRSSLVLAACDGSPTQRFTIETDQTVRLGAWCLDAPKGPMLRIASCDGSTRQRFSADPGQLISRSEHACVDVVAGRIVADAGIVLRDCDQAVAHQWWYLAS